MLKTELSRGEKETSTHDAEVSESLKAQLSLMVGDRMGLWAARDFGGRPKFREYFAHSEITRDAADPNTFSIKNGPIEKIRLKDGFPELMEGFGRAQFGSFGSRRIEYKKLGGTIVGVTAHSGGESLRGEWREIAPGFIWPVKMTMSAVFGKDWGPQEITFTAIAVE